MHSVLPLLQTGSDFQTKIRAIIVVWFFLAQIRVRHRHTISYYVNKTLKKIK